MDYNADIPFERAPAPGFYDTQEEMASNEHSREMFDPRKQQLANKRKGDGQEEGQEPKRRKNEKDSGAAAYAAAAKAGQLQRIREAEQSSKRRGLTLPAPQVSESELEDIVKMGMTGDRASTLAGISENDATRGLVGNYSNMVGATPIRTPRAPQEEDRIANEIRNARARTETQSALLGGEATPIHEGLNTTGYEGVAPSKQALATPNPLATPMRQGNMTGATPRGPGATPMRTPRDNFRLNPEDGSMQLVGQTPRDIRLQEQATRSSLRGKLSSLPKPREMEFELDLPEEQVELSAAEVDALRKEDSAARDRRNAAIAEAAALADFKRQTRVVQRGLPRPKVIDIDALLKVARTVTDPIARQIAEESALLIAHDAAEFGGARVNKTPQAPISVLDEESMQKAQMEVILEMGQDASVRSQFGSAFAREWQNAHDAGGKVLPGFAGYAEDELDEEQLLIEAFGNVQDALAESAQRGQTLEKKLAKHHGGYVERGRRLRAKINEAAEFLEKTTLDTSTARTAQVVENATLQTRLEGLREEVSFVRKREREAQEVYRLRKGELEALGG
jgi:pre-mRNA-splicing factor CDC5/CEF1